MSAAFPSTVTWHNERKNVTEVEHEDGMSKRDYFAARAMQAMVTRGDCANMSINQIAEHAYRIADAMEMERLS